MDLLTYHDWMAVMNKNQMAEEYANKPKTGGLVVVLEKQRKINDYLAGFDACEKMYSDAGPLDEDDFCEQQVLELSTNGTVGNMNAADFRIGFRYGFRRTVKEANKRIAALEAELANSNKFAQDQENELAKMKESREDIELNHLAELTAMEARGME